MEAYYLKTKMENIELTTEEKMEPGKRGIFYRISSIKSKLSSLWENIGYYFYRLSSWIMVVYYLLILYIFYIWLSWSFIRERSESVDVVVGFFWIIFWGIIVVPINLILISICLYLLVFRKTEYVEWRFWFWFSCIGGIVYFPIFTECILYTPLGNALKSFFTMVFG